MHVILLAPHFPAGQRRFLRALKSVGAMVTGIVDGPVDTEVKHFLDQIVTIDNVTSEEQVYRAVRKIQDKGPWVHKLEATIEAHVLTAARVRERTAIPGTPAETVLRCRDKVLMKTFLKEHGIPSAAHEGVETAGECRAFADRVGYPLIIKPRDGAGSAGTYRVDDDAELEWVIHELGMDRRPTPVAIEEFVEGHEGFYDTLTVNGRIVMDFVSHYYPNVLPAMRDPGTPAMIVTSNRIAADSYGELKKLGAQVNDALGLGTTATHMEWFFGPKGLRFSEIGARPPGVNFWDVYCAANEIDLYEEWARAVCYGDVHAMPSRRYSGGLISLRPTRQGTVHGYTGVDEVYRKYGAGIVKAHLPPVGSRTQPIEAGYLANAWLIVRHPDYDGCKAVMEDIGRTLRMHAG
ncbi:MAG: ATP-grasp domain-containing protein [Deltaproteobacteria bacterium]|nr:MAG: ATP-grasp domain-containing protein [Deltaproteobacteria bacterium]